MLRYLSIRRLAVIDTLDLEFGPGLSVLTGETGAGKSIVVDALELLLGGRSSSDLVRTGADAATVQAVVETPDGRETIVRREVLANGRSRAFLDDALVTTTTLREVMGPLVDLHGQHDHQGLLDTGRHLDLLDRHAGHEGLCAGVAADFRAYRTALDAVESRTLDERERAARLELVRYQLSEIDRVAPQPGEDDDLLAERQVLSSAERVERLASESYLLLYEGDSSISVQVARAWKRLADLATIDPRFEPWLALRDQVSASVDEVARFLRDYLARIERAPDRLQAVEERLAALERVKRKYGPDLDSVLARRSELLATQEALDLSAERLATLEVALDAARGRYLESALELSTARAMAGPTFARALERELGQLALEHARCELRLTSSRAREVQWTVRGIDAGELYLSTNPGEALRPLARVASGGELSRVLLAIKTIASTDAPGRTLVFDEVDAGIGGRAADAVGARLRALAANCQVLAVTHLPQVAAHGQIHYRVEKAVEGGRTLTTVTRLSGETRVHELARMIGGASVTEPVIEGAREMLASRAPGLEAKGESERAKAKGKRSGAHLSR